MIILPSSLSGLAFQSARPGFGSPGIPAVDGRRGRR